MQNRAQVVVPLKKGVENILFDNQICIHKMIMLECSVIKENGFNPRDIFFKNKQIFFTENNKILQYNQEVFELIEEIQFPKTF